MNDRRPRQSETLERLLTDAFSDGTIWRFISDGIWACLENANSLRADFLTLARGGRFPAAQFTYATCLEETGKAVILFDVARIDRATGFMPHLCRAFYNHAAKFGYARVLASPGRGDLAAALERYRIETVEYWRNPDPEDGEPDTLAAGLYARESALYVDYVEFDGAWFRPTSSILPRFYADPTFLGNSGSTSGQIEIEAALQPLEQARSESLFSPDSLAIVSEEYSVTFCNAGCDAQVDAIRGRVAERLQRSGIPFSASTANSNLMKFPLYAMIAAPDRIPRF